MPDHCHLFFDLDFNNCIESSILKVMEQSEKWMNASFSFSEKFYWQEGCAAVSRGLSDAHELIDELLNQEEFHKKHSFREEYIALLEANEIEFKESDLFEFRD